MSSAPLWQARWAQVDGLLRVVEPTHDEIVAAAARLADYYNDPHNLRMLAHDDEMTYDEVLEHYDDLRDEGGHPFLLYVDHTLIGDGDLRHFGGGAAEVAIMIGDRAAQGRGLGTRFNTMLHALAFGAFDLERVYAGIIPANLASRRLFERLGYRPDDSPEARSYADAEDDLTFSIGRVEFEAAHAGALAEIELGLR